MWEYPGMTYTKMNPQTCRFHRTIQILDRTLYKGETMWRTIELDPRTHCTRLTWASVGAADSFFGAVSYAGSTAILSGIFCPDPLLGAAATSHRAVLPRAPGIPGAVD